VPQVIDGCARVVQRAHSGRLETIEPSRPAIANCGAGTEPRGDQVLPLKSLEGRMRGAGRHVAPEARLNFLQNRATVGVLSEADNRKQHGLLE
jgi:hypothetical protein